MFQGRRKTSRDELHFPPTPSNIGLALWEVDSAAGRTWDPSRKLTFARKPGLSQDGLRNAVVHKAIEDGLAVLAGFHALQERATVWQRIQTHWEYDEQSDTYDMSTEDFQGGRWVTECRVKRLDCYELSGYRFVDVVEERPRNGPQKLPPEIADVGKWLSGARRPLARIALQDAQVTLEAYLKAGMQPES
jgi:hypothetical protein